MNCKYTFGIIIGVLLTIGIIFGIMMIQNDKSFQNIFVEILGNLGYIVIGVGICGLFTLIIVSVIFSIKSCRNKSNFDSQERLKSSDFSQKELLP